MSEAPRRRPLPRCTLEVPRFAGVEPPVALLEMVVLGLAVNVTGLALVPLAVVSGAVAALHAVLAVATRRDRRLTLVLARSLRYPRHARPWPGRETPRPRFEPSFPRRAWT